ncbi:uncharacterized protein LOC133153224 isoform X2 [Syngnathus typhle]|uniref:uncharacterized protein LOC133153224 isoform X2 n=1 Tax=Syngnathus typhle TaxID=161592 RepID=UPI002A69FDB0|nr:uncharacterized protein LOC133153224 isoform X2 [Syngnathus typhle]
MGSAAAIGLRIRDAGPAAAIGVPSGAIRTRGQPSGPTPVSPDTRPSPDFKPAAPDPRSSLAPLPLLWRVMALAAAHSPAFRMPPIVMLLWEARIRLHSTIAVSTATSELSACREQP